MAKQLMPAGQRLNLCLARANPGEMTSVARAQCHPPNFYVEPPTDKMKDLPEELWLRVFRGFADIDLHHQQIGVPAHPVRTLAKLCHVCKRFCRIAQPLLYEFPRGMTQLKPALFRTLVERRDLAQRARSLTLEDLPGNEPSTSINEALEFVRESNLPDALAKALEETITDEDSETQVAVCLALLPNLRRLSLPLGYNKSGVLEFFQIAGRPRWADQGTQAVREADMLPELKELSLSHYDTESALGLWESMDIFAHPPLERFCGHAIDLTGPMPERWASQRLGIKYISLGWSLMDGDGLESLLTLCPQLSTLKVEWGSATVGSSDMNFNSMGDALRRHATNLETLDLDPRDSFEVVDGGESMGRIGSLRELPKLRRLRISEVMLLGEDDSDLYDSDSSEAADIQPPLKLEEVLPENLESYYFYT